ncbi:MAG: TrkA family potassium uptake protein [Saprospiraceae bacterium]
MRLPSFLRITHNTSILTLRMCAYMLLVSMLVGTAGYMLIEGYTFGNALYMAVITISTVGFGEIRPLSPLGRFFTSGFVIVNLGITAIFVSTLTQQLRDGGITFKLRHYLMEREISNLSNHVIVCGAGRYGREIVDQLQDSEEQIILIERDQSHIDQLTERHPTLLYIVADATNDEALLQAGILNAKSLIVTLGDDSDNAFTVLSARQLCIERDSTIPSLNIIARVYKAASRAKLKRVGADHVIQPEQIGSFYMATLVRKPSAVEFFTSLANGASASVGFEEIPYDKLPASLQQKSLLDMDLRRKTGVSVVAMRYPDGHYEVNPDPTSKLIKGTSLIALGDAKQLAKLTSLIG